MKLHFLDCAALNDLVEPDQVHVRHNLIERAKARELLVPATWPLIWEVAATRAVNETKYHKMLDLLWAISARRFLQGAHERMVKELRSGDALGVPGCLDAELELNVPADVAEVDASATKHRDRSRQMVEEEVAIAAATAEMLLANEKKGPDSQPWQLVLKGGFRHKKHVYDLADHYALEGVQRIAKENGIDPSGLDHRRLPTFWSAGRIHAARVIAVMVTRVSPVGKKIPKAPDLQHLREAESYADVFVTSDRRLRLFAERVIDLRCEVLDYKQWAARLT
jgi:hypothetical protein